MAAELRAGLSGLPEVGRVGSLVRGQDGRSAMLPVVLDVDGAHGYAGGGPRPPTRVPAVEAATATVARAHPGLTVGAGRRRVAGPRRSVTSSATTSSAPRR